MRQLNMADLVIVLCALGSGLIAGLFFAFSTSVMKALGQQPPAHGIAAMQAINVVILNPWFLTVFMGTALLCLFAIIRALVPWHGAVSMFLLAGAVLYLLGTFGVTMLFNVPRNNLLANVAAGSNEAALLWARYLREWTFWNHVRMLAALAAMAAFIIALRLEPGS